MSNYKPKIVLYNPTTVFYDMPLALLALGSCFDASKYNVVIIDGRIEKNAHEKVIEQVKDALCFGTTVLTGGPIKDAINMTRKVKESTPDIPTIWGGWHTSLFPTEPMEEEDSIDITVQGQGEITFQELVHSFLTKSNISAIKGICYRDSSGAIVKNPPRSIEDMNDLPQVDYDLIDVEKYFIKKGRRQFDYISSIGCFYRCTFCADPFVFNRKFSAISAKRMGTDLAYYYSKYSFTSINFQDETFFTYKDRVLDFSKELINRNINVSWAATMRADQGDRITKEEFRFLAKSGLKRVLVGVESGSQEMMDWLKKDIKIEQVIETAEKCMESGVGAQFPFIVGFPDESETAFNNSIDLAIRLGNMSETFNPVIFYFKPYPGTAITEDVVKEGFELPSTLEGWSKFDYVTSSGPWVSEERFDTIEKLKFYLKLSKNKHIIGYPLKWIAKKRLQNKQFAFPIEKMIINKIKPSQKLA